MSASISTIGFIGTGIMGAHMARRLAEAGFAVRAWNRDPAKAEALTRYGVHAVRRAVDSAKGSDVVICMLSTGQVCDEILRGADGVIESMHPGAALVVMSSIPVETAQGQALQAADNGVRYIDAPVSGGENGARDGTLAIMAGGEPKDVERLAGVFAALGRVTHVGPAGSGQLAKLANQMIVATNICAVAEALMLAERGGADPARVRQALLGGFADSTVLRQHGQRMIDGNFVPGGPAKYQLKDTSTALGLAATLGLQLPVAEQVDALFRRMVGEDGGDLDHSGVLLTLRSMNS